MPSTVGDLVGSAGLTWTGCVRWGQTVPLDQPGIYIVALTPAKDSLAGARAVAPISLDRVEELLAPTPFLRASERVQEPGGR